MKLLLSRVPITRACEILEIKRGTYYDKLEFSGSAVLGVFRTPRNEGPSRYGLQGNVVKYWLKLSLVQEVNF